MCMHARWGCAVQDFDVLWQAAVDDASERALQLLHAAAQRLLSRHSGYLTPSHDELLVRMRTRCMTHGAATTHGAAWRCL